MTWPSRKQKSAYLVSLHLICLGKFRLLLLLELCSAFRFDSCTEQFATHVLWASEFILRSVLYVLLVELLRASSSCVCVNIFRGNFRRYSIRLLPSHYDFSYFIRNHQYLILKLSRRAHTMASMLVNLSRNLRRANYARGNLWTSLSSAAKPRSTFCKCKLFLINFVEFIFQSKMGEMIEVSNW